MAKLSYYLDVRCSQKDGRHALKLRISAEATDTRNARRMPSDENRGRQVNKTDLFAYTESVVERRDEKIELKKWSDKELLVSLPDAIRNIVYGTIKEIGRRIREYDIVLQKASGEDNIKSGRIGGSLESEELPMGTLAMRNPGHVGETEGAEQPTISEEDANALGETEEQVIDTRYSRRTKPEPKKQGTGYKVFFLKDGKLYPPMVAFLGEQ